MLTDTTLESILAAIPRLRMLVVGDLFLDRYLDLAAEFTEPSIETGLDAYQVTAVRAYPGAAGTVVNNLAALGVQAIHVIAVIGDDGEGYELRQALARMPAVRTGSLLACADRRTPTYTKPMLCVPGQPPRELHRLDFKNRRPLPPESETTVMSALDALWPRVDAMLVLDQVSEANCGVITDRVRQRVAELGSAERGRVILADSRERIGRFANVCVKPNEAECLRAVTGSQQVPAAAQALAARAGRIVFCTRGAQGILVVDPARSEPSDVPAYPVTSPIDTVGAGDSTSAAIACALASGATPAGAAAFGNLVASITIQQIGTTGTASPEQIRKRWGETN
jgi:rfaE bifunctional protein kinase chain/domain